MRKGPSCPSNRSQTGPPGPQTGPQIWTPRRSPGDLPDPPGPSFRPVSASFAPFRPDWPLSANLAETVRNRPETGKNRSLHSSWTFPDPSGGPSQEHLEPKSLVARGCSRGLPKGPERSPICPISFRKRPIWPKPGKLRLSGRIREKPPRTQNLTKTGRNGLCFVKKWVRPVPRKPPQIGHFPPKGGVGGNSGGTGGRSKNAKKRPQGNVEIKKKKKIIENPSLIKD